MRPRQPAVEPMLLLLRPNAVGHPMSAHRYDSRATIGRAGPHSGPASTAWAAVAVMAASVKRFALSLALSLSYDPRGPRRN